MARRTDGRAAGQGECIRDDAAYDRDSTGLSSHAHDPEGDALRNVWHGSLAGPIARFILRMILRSFGRACTKRDFCSDANCASSALVLTPSGAPVARPTIGRRQRWALPASSRRARAKYNSPEVGVQGLRAPVGQMRGAARRRSGDIVEERQRSRCPAAAAKTGHHFRGAVLSWVKLGFAVSLNDASAPGTQRRLLQPSTWFDPARRRYQSSRGAMIRTRVGSSISTRSRSLLPVSRDSSSYWNTVVNVVLTVGSNRQLRTTAIAPSSPHSNRSPEINLTADTAPFSMVTSRCTSPLTPAYRACHGYTGVSPLRTRRDRRVRCHVWSLGTVAGTRAIASIPSTTNFVRK